MYEVGTLGFDEFLGGIGKETYRIKEN